MIIITREQLPKGELFINKDDKLISVGKCSGGIMEKKDVVPLCKLYKPIPYGSVLKASYIDYGITTIFIDNTGDIRNDK